MRGTQGFRGCKDLSRDLYHGPERAIGGEALQDRLYALRIERLFGHAASQGGAHFHRQHRRDDAIVLAKECEHLAPTEFFDVALDERACVEIRVVVHRWLYAIVDDRLREWRAGDSD